MKLKTKSIGSNILTSIPFSFKNELTGYIDNKGIHYKSGTKVNCPTFPDKSTVFHTHIDINPTDTVVTLPDMPSPVDIIVFMVIDNHTMYIKTPRVFLTFKKTKKSQDVTEKILTCIMQNEAYWKKLVKQQKHDKMFFFLLHFLRKNLDKKNRTWSLSWKRIVEQIFKVKVNIQTSDVKDRI